MAWRLQDGGEYHIGANILEGTQGFVLKYQIFIDEKPSNYEFANKTENLTGEEVFALFAEE